MKCIFSRCVKSFVIAFALLFSVNNANADLPVKFPDWLKDSTAKVWAVERLMSFMADKDFYKIKDIIVKREFDQENKCDSLQVNLTFSDPTCENRQVRISTLAPLCGDLGCDVMAMLTDCRQTTELSSQKIMSR